MQQSELINQLKAALRRGDTLDAEIPLYIQQSVEFIERNHKLTYMDSFGEFKVLSEEEIISDTVPKNSNDYWNAVNKARTITLPSRMRALKVVKRLFYEVDDEGLVIRKEEGKVLTEVEYSGYLQVRPVIRSAEDSTSPAERYYSDGNRTIILDGIPSGDKSSAYVIGWEAYSNWSKDADFSHYLLDIASGLLFSQTMVGFAARLNMPNVRLQQYRLDAQMQLKALLNADQDYRHKAGVGFDAADVYPPYGYPPVQIGITFGDLPTQQPLEVQ